MILVYDLQYFAPVIFYFKLDSSSNCVFEQYDMFQKMSFRNRCTLPGANGAISLTVPLLGGREQKTLMKDVRVDNKEDWQARHWKTITSCYNKSPWFDFYRDELDLLFKTETDFLVDWNLKCFEWICDKMSIKTPWSLSGSYIKNYDQNDVLDWRSELAPSTINQKYPDVKRYPQVFEDRLGFIPNMSILDYLFCNGNKLY